MNGRLCGWVDGWLGGRMWTFKGTLQWSCKKWRCLSFTDKIKDNFLIIAQRKIQFERYKHQWQIRIASLTYNLGWVDTIPKRQGLWPSNTLWEEVCNAGQWILIYPVALGKCYSGWRKLFKAIPPEVRISQIQLTCTKHQTVFCVK